MDENGEPIRSPEEIKNIINSIPSFKYEEKKDTAADADKSSSTKQQPGKGGNSAHRHEDNKDSCAICLDDLKTGQMVKALRCSHKFHEKCINNWLKQKLLCPLCKEKIDLNNFN